ncbi:MAG: response regulator transcription factor [bacterium]
MIRVLIADDHALVRRGLRNALEPFSDIVVVGEAVTGPDVIPAVTQTRPDVLLLDIAMPGGKFLDVLEHLRRHEPKVRTLVVSMHAEALYAKRAIRAGAAGYINKSRAEDELLTAIREVGHGRRYVSPELAQELAAELASGRGATPHDALTNREHEVMLLLASGLTASQVAGNLGLSVKTVSTHRTRLLAKMDLTTNADLVRYALAHGLIS